MPGQKGMKRYPNAIKEEAIRLFFVEKKTRKEITQELNLRDEDNVKKWVRKYRRKGMAALICMPKGRPRKKESPEAANARIRYLEMENDLLRNFLYELGRR